MTRIEKKRWGKQEDFLHKWGQRYKDSADRWTKLGRAWFRDNSYNNPFFWVPGKKGEFTLIDSGHK